jgi:hypothetical protein
VTAAAAPFARAPWRPLIRAARWALPRDREGAIAWGMLAFAVAFNATYLWPEVAVNTPKLNDGALHVVVLQRMLDAFKAGQDPTDPWLKTVTMGYPFLHYYQHLPFVGPALAAWALPDVGVQTIFNSTQYALFCAFPVSIYWSMRRFGFAPVIAGLSAVAAPVLSTHGLFGFDDNSYVWIGYGMYTQLWGMVLLPIALAQAYRTLRDGGGYFWSVLLVGAMLLTHLVLAYIALVTLVAFVLLRPARADVVLRGRRLALLLVLVAIVTAYFMTGVLRDNAYLNRSVWEDSSKYDAFGYEWTLRALFGGRLFDYGRFRWLTLAVLAGPLVCAWRWRDERYRIPAVVGGLWLAMYFGRPTWGVLIGLATLNVQFYLHRLIAGVHLGGIMLIGVALAVPWQWAFARKRAAWLLAPAAVTALIFAPVYNERRDYLLRNEHFMQLSDTAYERDQVPIEALEARLRTLPPGRVYAGFRGGWGNQYAEGEVPVSVILQDAGFDMLGYLWFPFSFNSDVQTLFDESRPEHYNLFNVRYVVAPKDRTFPSFVQPVADFGRHRLYRVVTSGYFDLVSSDVAFAGDIGQLYPAGSSWLSGPLPAAKEHPAIVLPAMTPPDGLHPLPIAIAQQAMASRATDPGPSRGEIVSESQGSNSYTATAHVLRQSVLMLKETYHPGWHVTVDGRDAKTMMLMPSYIGVQMTPGTHAVRFEYRPPSSRMPLLALGLLLLPLIALAEWRGPRLLRRWSAPRLLRRWSAPRLNGGRRRSARGDLTRGVATTPASPSVAIRPERDGTRSGLKTALGVYLLFLSIYLVGASGHFYSSEEIAAYITAKSMVDDHDLSVSRINDTVRGRNGAYFSVFGLGESVAAAPLYAGGAVVDRWAPSRVREYFKGHETFYGNQERFAGTVPIFFASLLNKFIAPLICVLVFMLLLEFGFSRRVSFLTTLLLGLGSAVFVSAHEFFQHPLETVMLLGAIYVLISHRTEPRARHALLAGAFLAFGIFTRTNLLLVAPWIALYLIAITRKARPAGDGAEPAGARAPVFAGIAHRFGLRRINAHTLRCLLAFIVPCAIALAVMMFLNYWRYNNALSFNPVAAEQGFSISTVPVALYGYLVSPGRSIFLYSPPLVLALFGARRFYDLHRAEALLFGAIACTFLLSYSTFALWDGGWAWGPRYMLPLVPLLIIPAAYVLQTRRGVLVAAVFCLFGLGIQVLGTVENVNFVTSARLAANGDYDKTTLFIPGISPVPTFLRHLLRNDSVDLWLIYVWEEFGTAVMLLTLAVPASILAAAAWLLRDLFKRPATPPASAPHTLAD